jgi:hypothetical protein
VAFVHDVRDGAVSQSVSAQDARRALAIALQASAALPQS